MRASIFSSSKSKFLVSITLIFICESCIIPPCTQDNAFQFDKWGRPKKVHKRKDPMPILIKRCTVDGCKTRKTHCHGNGKYRGSAWWQMQNPDTGEGQKIYMNN
ncbi:MAG: hypothetical protein ACKVOU_09835 [Cytophagales bacterium]